MLSHTFRDFFFKKQAHFFHLAKEKLAKNN